ncbi:hypothetical protein V8G54_034150 [Vigna mungo]|uniref:Putative plant transposon protein domain-containing protein n=1 Tax=Vigna mungo TaxID=3915 RepID=A0AAQ3MPY2_VIGMU
MASSSRSADREKGKKRISVKGSDPMSWISDEESRRRFLNATQKIFVDPMNVNLSLFKNEGLMFPYWFERQGLSIFVEMKGYWYLDLVKVFYHNLRVEDDVNYSRVKGTDIYIDDFTWNIFTNLPSEDALSHLPTADINALLSKKHVYKDWLRFLGMYDNENIFAHEGLQKEEKIMAHLLAKRILPGRILKDRMTLEDIYLLHAVRNNTPVNWLCVIKDHLKNSSLKRSLYLPYACLISKILVLQGVEIRNEQKRFWGSSNTFSKDSLASLGLVKTINQWNFMGENIVDHCPSERLNDSSFFPETKFEKYIAQQIEFCMISLIATKMITRMLQRLMENIWLRKNH